jgi:hypothetical protein
MFRNFFVPSRTRLRWSHNHAAFPRVSASGFFVGRIAAVQPDIPTGLLWASLAGINVPGIE